MRFLHCSDVHITYDYFHQPLWPLGWRRWIALLELQWGGRSLAYAKAEQTLKTISSEAQRHNVQHLIVSGDLTAYAMEDEFQRAYAALKPWVDDVSKCSVIKGNHDTYTRDAVQEKRFEKYFGHLLKSDLPEYAREEGFPYVRLVGDEAAVVGLNSARLNPMPGLSYGHVGTLQLQGLEQLLGDVRLRHRAVLVLVHHAPMKANGQPDKFTHGLFDAKKLLQLLPGPQFAVLHGHIHRRFHHPATETRPHVVGAGSSTQAGKEGYWLIDVQDGKFVGFESVRPFA